MFPPIHYVSPEALAPPASDTPAWLPYTPVSGALNTTTTTTAVPGTDSAPASTPAASGDDAAASQHPALVGGATGLAVIVCLLLAYVAWGKTRKVVVRGARPPFPTPGASSPSSPRGMWGVEYEEPLPMPASPAMYEDVDGAMQAGEHMYDGTLDVLPRDMVPAGVALDRSYEAPIYDNAASFPPPTPSSHPSPPSGPPEPPARSVAKRAVYLPDNWELGARLADGSDAERPGETA